MNESTYTSPEQAFSTLLQHFWAVRADDDEPWQQWERFCQTKPKGAAELMAGVDAFAADPPSSGIAQLVSREGFISLRHPDGTAFSETEQSDWLQTFAGYVRSVYDRARSSPSAVLADAMHRFWLLPAEPPEAAWSEYARAQPAEANALLERLEAVAADPPADFVQILQTWGGIRLDRDDAQTYADWLRAQLTALRAAAPGSPASGP
jgi:hypothetical protein